MRFTLLVLSPPDTGPSNRHALEFAKSVLSRGHELACVFFYDAGVLTALNETEAVQDEGDLRSGWERLAAEGATHLVACVASAARFGLGDRDDSPRLRTGFSIAGLGELVDSSRNSDRLLTFAD